MAGFFSRFFGLEDKADFKALLEDGAILLDVRTKEEYKQGAVINSINIFFTNPDRFAPATG